jgi:ribose 5-phosphate isomerase B
MPSSQKVLIASDHAGVSLKSSLQKLLPDWTWIDLGPSDSGRVDYPDYAETLSRKVASGEATQGILICGSGIGMSIAANKIPGIRAAVVENPVAAQLAKEHNNANVLCIGARFLAPDYAADIVKIFLQTRFTGEERHQNRIKKIAALEV